MVSVTTSVPRNGEVSETDLANWLGSIAEGRSAEELRRIRDACGLAVERVDGRVLASGVPEMRHILTAADILARLRLDTATLVAALVLPLAADGVLAEEEILRRFGGDVAAIVRGGARMGSVALGAGARPNESKGGKDAENQRRLLLGLAEDVRAVLVMLADRLASMRELRALPESQRRSLAQETLDVYTALANRLGVWQLKWELEDLCLRYLQPDAYMRIARLLDERREDREQFINGVIGLLQEKLRAAGIKAEISGRPKHIYSIWRKMQRKALSFEQIFDVRAVRILVDDVADCYATLGLVHGLWRHIPGEFDDYIASPKANMYQSLHTAVIGPDDKTLEVQIRTFDMHQHSELGVAAHWRYKENRKHDAEFERRILWMRQWLELQEPGADAEGVLESLPAQTEPSLVYVLTPKAKVIELPHGATPLDFAYAIHTQVGHRCRGARVDGRIVPLTYPLHSGETVEILTTRDGGPSRDWLVPRLGYLKTQRARGRVRQWFKQLDFQAHLDAGRSAVEKELKRLSLPRPDLDRLAGRFSMQKAGDLLAAVGRGEITAAKVLAAAEPQRSEVDMIAPRPIRHRRHEGDTEVIVDGVGNLMTHMARCCKPLPQDPIVGFITRGRGVTVHRQDCPNIRRMDASNRERLIEASWSGDSSQGDYLVDMRILAYDRQGLLRDVSSILSNEEVNVVGVQTQSNKRAETADMRFTLEIRDLDQLARVLNKVAQVPDVLEVRRQV